MAIQSYLSEVVGTLVKMSHGLGNIHERWNDTNAPVLYVDKDGPNAKSLEELSGEFNGLYFAYRKEVADGILDDKKGQKLVDLLWQIERLLRQ